MVCMVMDVTNLSMSIAHLLPTLPTLVRTCSLIVDQPSTYPMQWASQAWVTIMHSVTNIIVDIAGERSISRESDRSRGRDARESTPARENLSRDFEGESGPGPGSRGAWSKFFARSPGDS